MERVILLDVVVRERAVVLQLLTGDDATLLVWQGVLLIPNLGLDVVDSVACQNIKSDRLSIDFRKDLLLVFKCLFSIATSAAASASCLSGAWPLSPGEGCL